MTPGWKSNASMMLLVEGTSGASLSSRSTWLAKTRSSQSRGKPSTDLGK